MIGFLLVLLAGVRSTVYVSLFWLPTAFFVGMIAVRVAPFLVPPTLVAHKPRHITTLGLGDSEEDRHDEP
jgi:hypothetical protein